jgi:hypothetical protein
MAAVITTIKQNRARQPDLMHVCVQQGRMQLSVDVHSLFVKKTTCHDVGCCGSSTHR